MGPAGELPTRKEMSQGVEREGEICGCDRTAFVHLTQTNPSFSLSNLSFGVTNSCPFHTRAAGETHGNRLLKAEKTWLIFGSNCSLCNQSFRGGGEAILPLPINSCN